jgi:large subunit ribosomal protein L9
MKLILTRDVTDLGKSGQLVNVADGYARNFLLPRKLAIEADAGALAALENKRKVLEVKGEKLAAEAQGIAEKIDNLQVTVTGKAGSGTKLYGSVTSQEIAVALMAQHNIKVDKRTIHITDPIKSIGTFEVPIKLHHDVTATIHVEVVAQAE